MYCRGYTDETGKFFIRAFFMKMSSTFKNRQVRTFGGFLLRFSSLLYMKSAQNLLTHKKGLTSTKQSVFDSVQRQSYKQLHVVVEINILLYIELVISLSHCQEIFYDAVPWKEYKI